MDPLPVEPAEPTTDSRIDWRPAAWLLAAQLLSMLLYFMGSWEGFSNWEELHTPSAALMILQGYLGDLLGMQYMPFCGGCTVDALLAAPLTAVGGPSLLLWKLIPWGFSLLTLGAGYWVVHRQSGRTAAILFGFVLVLAPTAYHHLQMVGFSNHVQVMGLVWLAVVAWTRALETEGWRWPFLLGLLLGGAFYYCYTAAFALPVLLGLYLAWRPRDIMRLRGLALLGGLALPLGWWAWAQAHMPARAGTDLPFFAIYHQHAAGMLSFAHVLQKFPRLGPTGWRSLYAPALGEETVLVGGAVAAVLAFGVLAASWHALRVVLRREARPLEVALPALALAFLALYLLADSGVSVPNERAWHPEILRYQGPLFSLAAACAAGAISRLWLGRGRGLAVALALLLVGPGLTARLAAVDPDHLSARSLFLHGTDWGTIRDRINVPEVAEVDDAAAFVAGHERISRRVLLGNLAEKVAEGMPGPMRAALAQRFAAWAAQLGEEDRISLLRGLVRALPGTPGVAESFQEVLAALDPTTACLMQREHLRADAELQGRFNAALADTGPLELPLLPGVCGEDTSAWFLGYQSVNFGFIANDRDPRGALSTLTRAQASLLRLERTGRATFMEGAGERAGELWGYSPGTHRRLSAAVAVDQSAAFEAGFARGARSSFVWPMGL